MSDKNLPAITKGTGVTLNNIGKSLRITSKLLINADKDWQWWLSITDEWKKIFLSYIFRDKGNNDWDMSNLDDINLESKKDMRANINQITEMTEFYLRDYYPFEIEDISPLSYLTNLTRLSFGYQGILDISPLKHLTNLSELNFYDVILATDFSALKNLKNLKILTLFWGGYRLGNADKNGNRILLDNSIITLVADLVSLEELHIAETVVTDISLLANLKKLTELTIADSQIFDISPLENLKDLTTLNFGNSQTRDFNSLSNLTKLKKLFLYGNKIKDTSFLGNLSNLDSLYLKDNKITDISSISKLVNLKQLNLSNNNINRIISLVKLKKLTSLDLQDNPIPKEEIEWLGNQLPECFI